MTTDFTDEHRQIDETVRRCLTAHADHAGDSGTSAIEAALVDMGLAAALTGSAEDGLGLPLLAIVAEAIGGHLTPTNLTSRAVGAWLLAELGRTGELSGLADSVAAGQLVPALAMHEGGSDWTAKGWTVHGPHLTGVKLHIEATAMPDLLIVGLKGGQFAVVKASAATLLQHPTLDPASTMLSARFEGARPIAIGGDSRLCSRALDALALLCAAEAYGAARAMLELTVAFVNERRQFGQSLGSLQGIRFQLAELAVRLVPARHLLREAASEWAADAGPERRSVALAKALCCDLAVETGRLAVKLHGAIGYTWEYPLHRLLKRAMIKRELWGSPEEFRRRIAAAGFATQSPVAKQRLANVG